MKKKTIKATVYTAIGLVLFGTSAVLMTTPISTNDSSQTQAAVEESVFTLEIIDREGDVLSNEFAYAEGDSLMDGLKANVDIYEEGGFITAIEDLEPNVDNQEFLMLSVDGEMAMTGADDIELTDGLVVTIELDTWE